MRVKLVSDWPRSWRWLSVHLSAAAAVALELYEQFETFREFIPPPIFHHGMSVFVALIIVGRLVKQ